MINKFEGQYEFLSNFFPSVIEYGGIQYPTVEHAFQAAKSLSEEEQAAISIAKTPGIAKRLGRKVVLRPDWEEVKIEVMRQCLAKKFEHPDLCAKLLATGDEELIEGNHWHDNFWGSCSCEKCGGNGQNQLGKLLMKIRNEYMEVINSLNKIPLD